MGVPSTGQSLLSWRGGGGWVGLLAVEGLVQHDDMPIELYVFLVNHGHRQPMAKSKLKNISVVESSSLN